MAYGSVLQRTRRALHAQVAHWLVGLGGSPPPDLVAEHFERGALPALAAHHWQRAAEAAVARYADSDALVFARRAPALLDAGDTVRRYPLTLLRCRVQDLLSERAALAEAIDDLQVLADRLGDAGQLSEAMRLRARHTFDGADAAPALAQARQAVALADTSAPAAATKASARTPASPASIWRWLG